MKAMKFIAVFVALSLSMSAMCQTTAQLKAKQAKSVLKEKASKDARKEAKKMEKEGWKVSPGALPLEKQLDRAYMYALDIDEDMNQLYLLGEGKSVAGNYDAARMQATELARLEIARSISTEATSLIDNMVGNKQLDNEEAASMTTMLSESKTIIVNCLIRTGKCWCVLLQRLQILRKSPRMLSVRKWRNVVSR